LLDIDCRGVDANGFPVPKYLLPARSRHGVVHGDDCASLRAARSGVDTVVLTAGAVTADVPVRLAIRPTVDSPAGNFLQLVDAPPGRPWAPSTRIRPDGLVELYYANYRYDAAADLDRADLTRLVAVDSVRFAFDGIALPHGESLGDGDGRGIENVVVFPEAGGAGWRMLYAGGNEVSGWQVYGAVSADGRSWVKTGLAIGNACDPSARAWWSTDWPTGHGA
jgi:hypothetical protein